MKVWEHGSSPSRGRREKKARKSFLKAHAFFRDDKEAVLERVEDDEGNAAMKFPPLTFGIYLSP